MSILGFLPIIDKVLDRVIPDKGARAAAAEELAAAAQRGELDLVLGQLKINETEAAHKSLFVAGWRPYIGWVCGTGLAYNVIMSPLLGIWFEMPKIDSALLYPVLMGLLGMGAMRTVEKIQGVAREK